MGDAHDDGVAHAGVRLERLFDLLGEDLLAARVDGGRAASEQVDRAVGVDLGEVARDGVAHAVDHLERAFGLVGVLVIPERVAAAQGEHADLLGAGGHLGAVVIEHFDVRPQSEHCRGRGVAGARDRHSHADRFGRAEGVHQQHRGVMAQQLLLDRLAPHRAGGDHEHQRTQVPVAGLRVEGAEQRT